MYEYLIFDADHTLIDFYEDERAAFRRTFTHYGVPFTEEDIGHARDLSDLVWAEAGLNDVHLESVQAEFHTRYFSHLPFLAKRLKEFLPIDGEEQEIADRFVRELYTPAIEKENAYATFKALAEKGYKTCIATNGIETMQRARLVNFLPYTHALFVSERLGAIKPNKAFFTKLLNELDTTADKCLFIGDSLSSDIQGSLTVDMPCVWYNPKKLPLPKKYEGVKEIENFTELFPFLKEKN